MDQNVVHNFWDFSINPIWHNFCLQYIILSRWICSRNAVMIDFLSPWRRTVYYHGPFISYKLDQVPDVSQTGMLLRLPFNVCLNLSYKVWYIWFLGFFFLHTTRYRDYLANTVRIDHSTHVWSMYAIFKQGYISYGSLTCQRI